MIYIKDLFSGSGRLVLVASFAILLLVAGCSSGSKDDSKATGAPTETATTKAATTEAATAEPAADTGAAKESLPTNHPKMPEGTSMEKMAASIQKASHANIKTSKEVVLSDEMKAKWNEVQIAITDNSTRRTERVTIPVGSRIKLTEGGYYLTIDAFVPDYAISESKIVSRSDNPNNPAMLVSLYEKDKEITRGWVFKEFPEFNSYANSRFVLQLAGPGVNRPAIPAAAEPQKTH